ncbi:hypothetical protein HYH03_016627 [Edaphochlamys debaryana]|uniref:SAP domain-containing protein n=1 Tax=Edaphochlamys debaryana TaxID=47281 RepID=A0A836BR98_9CHLO|nr:hypothetical protein HYH03_016627 [Edaphochlamys debaryana]|eukprot:KAG2484584.1 hypothetical protein HYH03_016627 [Edaphochlamys debaryana]
MARTKQPARRRDPDGSRWWERPEQERRERYRAPTPPTSDDEEEGEEKEKEEAEAEAGHSEMEGEGESRGRSEQGRGRNGEGSGQGEGPEQDEAAMAQQGPAKKARYEGESGAAGEGSAVASPQQPAAAAHQPGAAKNAPRPGGMGPDWTSLPQEVWDVVFGCLARSLDRPGGVRGPSVVARDVVRAGLTCRDTLRAMPLALEVLAATVPLPRKTPFACPYLARLPDHPPSAVEWRQWDAVLCSPLEGRTEAELRAACRTLEVSCRGGKAELADRIRRCFRLDGPRCPVPSRLWLALLPERESVVREGTDQFRRGFLDPLRELERHTDSKAAYCARRAPSVWEARRILAVEFGDDAGLDRAHAPIGEILRAARQGAGAEAAAQEEAVEAARAEKVERAAVALAAWQEGEAEAAVERAAKLMAEADEAARRNAAARAGLADRRASLTDGSWSGRFPCRNSANAACAWLLCGACCRTSGLGPCRKHKVVA